MMELVNKYRSMTFEQKTIFSTRISMITNLLLAIGKFILSFFHGVFFFVAGIVNVLVMNSKLQCYLGEKYPEKKTFKYRNNMIGIFLFLAGLQYSIYMGRLIFTDVKVMDYSMLLGIGVACVSFVEMGIAIKGCFNSFGKGHYYRNIKLISLCSALTAIVLTEVALTSFAAEGDTRIINGIFGMSVGAIIVLISIYIYFAPNISIVDREHNVYKLKDGANKIEEGKVEIQLTHSKFYGNYTYVGNVKEDIIDGHIVKGKSPLGNWNIYVKILVIILSELLIFVYAGGALIFHFKNVTLIKKLDTIMLDKGYEKIEMNEQGVKEEC